MGHDVAVVSHSAVREFAHYPDVNRALSEWQPSYAVVANRTTEHLGSVEALVADGFRGRVLVEKPLFDSVRPLPCHQFSLTAVAYNLRCHPGLMRLRHVLGAEDQLVTANVYVGSYLPGWRPDTDYRQCYSAHNAEGGGVLRDLSHELDYVRWLFGPWLHLTAVGGHLSPLEIDSDDAYSVLMVTARCPLVSVHMNYLDRTPRREIRVNTGNQSLQLDLVRHTLSIDGVEEPLTVEPDDTYRLEHEAMLAGRADELCTLDEALATLTTIEAAERASLSRVWVAA
jgi:predicted dehydrogenase